MTTSSNLVGRVVKWVVAHWNGTYVQTESATQYDVAGFLARIPRAGARLVLVPGLPADPHYRCRIEMDTSALLPWAAHQARDCWSIDGPTELARYALPLWLADADLNNSVAMDLPQPFKSTIDIWISDFVSSSVAAVTCPSCSKLTQVYFENTPVTCIRPGNAWITQWRCQAGHVLYHRYEEMFVSR